MSDRLQRDLLETVSQVRSQVEYLRDIGLEDLLVTSAGEAMLTSAVEGFPSVDKAVETLEEIRAELGDCCRCGLGHSRKRLVFGVGNPQARLVLVGEAPGREEDETGEPFVGEAGRLLERILLAMGLRRDQVYICNVLKCRPPNNRDPESEEIACCEVFLVRQLAAIKPQVIITLGRFAAQTLLRDQAPISRLRGHWREYQGIPLMPTFHPAYLLRNPGGKRDVWEDMKQVMHHLRMTAE